jgi:hypothetical protein
MTPRSYSLRWQNAEEQVPWRSHCRREPSAGCSTESSGWEEGATQVCSLCKNHACFRN